MSKTHKKNCQENKEECEIIQRKVRKMRKCQENKQRKTQKKREPCKIKQRKMSKTTKKIRTYEIHREK